MIIGQDYILVMELAEDFPFEFFRYKKPSQETFETLDLEEGDFVHAGNGWYNIKLPAHVISEFGRYVFYVLGSGGESFHVSEVCSPAPINSALPPEVCLVIGNIRNLKAQTDVFEQVVITARPLRLPSINSGNLMLGKYITTYTDYDGFFQLPLVRGVEVLIEVKSAGVRFQAVVPNQDVIRIEDLMPNS